MDKMTKKEPDLVPQALAGRITGKSRQYISLLVKRGKIKPVEMYGQVLVSVEEVRKAIETMPKAGRPTKKEPCK